MAFAIAPDRAGVAYALDHDRAATPCSPSAGRDAVDTGPLH